MVFKSCILLSCLIAVTVALAADMEAQSRVKRSGGIGDYKLVVCNRTIWRIVFKHYLYSEVNHRWNNTNKEIRITYETALDNLNRWKHDRLNLSGNLDEACGLQQHLECAENSRCVCSAGSVPYSYETRQDGMCLAKRGSHCLDESDCLSGVLCQQGYCGGAATFLAELKKLEEAPQADNGYKFNVALMCYLAITLPIIV